MRADIKNLLAQKGYNPVFTAIDRSISDLKRHGYTKAEIKETIVEIFGNSDEKIKSYLEKELK